MIESRPGDAFQPGELLNNTYRIEALLGRGGTSDVYKARSEISGRLMALKVLKAELSGNDDFLVLLTREEEMRDIRHDAVVRYSECSRTASGLVYLMMDYVEGPGLDKRLKEGPMSADDLLIIARRVAEGLNAAHQRKIVHRDLSPDNIILRGGEPAGAVIIDFGIAKDTNPGAETIVGNEFAGKYAYAAPEQMNGQSDTRTDIYSLGALLLANFRGRPPDVGNNPMEVVQRKGEPLDTEGVPEPLKSL
ncbi:MAG: serine/threonine protein kinase, partial [Arenibacterium sp.]